MYIPAHFAETRPPELERIIKAHPFGTLVTLNDGELDANHLPFEFDARRGDYGVLLGHVARSNHVWQTSPTGSKVLVIFRGVDAYISPNWYPTKHESHRQVPTWNYEVVHAHGVITVQDDERFVRGAVARLTRQHEAAEPTPWKMGDSAPEFIEGMLRNIVGIEITITSIVGKAKLSQNKEARDRRGAAESLERQGDIELATRMRSTL